MRILDKKTNIRTILLRISVLLLIVIFTYFGLSGITSLNEIKEHESDFFENIHNFPNNNRKYLKKESIRSFIVLCITRMSSFMKIFFLKKRSNAFYSEKPIYLKNNKRQKAFRFRDMTFSSEVESGSLSHVKRLKNKKYLVYVSSDVVINQKNEEKRNWFNFQIVKVTKSQKIKISIRNLNYNWSMWKHGLVPVVRSNMKTKYKNWKLFNMGESTLVMKKGKLQLDFEYNLKKGEIVDVALTFPYTLTNLNDFMLEYQTKIQKVSQNMYIHRENLIKSNLGNPVNIYWIGMK